MEKKKTNYRWIICGFLWVAVAVNYVDRTALSAATPIIMKEFNIDGTEMGIIMAAFFWAYALLQVPMGYIADKFGQRLIYSLAVGWWSIAQMCIAACSSLVGFVTARLFLGVGEAGSYPCNVGVYMACAFPYFWCYRCYLGNFVVDFLQRSA